MADEKIRVWITTHALTKGIRQVDAELSSNSPNLVCYGGCGYSRNYAHGEGKDWHRTAESAVKRAEDMRDRKLASMRKSMAKLEAMVFVAPATD